jgi:hypothetical protein
MKNLILFLVFLLSINISFSQSSKTLIKSFELETNKVFFDISGEKKISYWDEKRIKIVLLAKVSTNETILNQFIKLGRYDLESKIGGDITIIKFVKSLRGVVIGGQNITESLDFEIYLPKGVEITNSIDAH